MTLTEFLLARIAEDEAIARLAADDGFAEWQYGEQYGAMRIETVALEGSYPNEHRVGITHDQEGLSDSVMPYAAPHIARHDPARVLAECEAKRRIIENHPADERGEFCHDDVGLTGCQWAWPCPTLRAIASVYADHPDYRPEWRP